MLRHIFIFTSLRNIKGMCVTIGIYKMYAYCCPAEMLVFERYCQVSSLIFLYAGEEIGVTISVFGGFYHKNTID